MSEKNKNWGSLSVLIAAVIAGVVAIEGGYSNDPNDSGGETNHGITVAVARDHGFTGAMADLTVEKAQEIYAESYIKKPKFDLVLALSPAVGAKLTDIGVNAGPGRAARWLQQSLNDLSRGGRDYAIVAADGDIGPRTIAAYEALVKRRGRIKACELTLKLLDGYQAAHYSTLAKGVANSSFMVGWVDHRLGNVPLSRCDESVSGV
ncbi:glycoside hydrolase family 108 protein [Lampropedia aestuarii]|uniref:glycoside hydrolase family 108 protein n=1 Tax=Lampropedia aestuarii TaxID=2562762 RepID=UPI002468A5CA|nr:glycosyl hydrolase 108 family protein [Lampropedia aestuarii]MDH5855683.1 glycosyl hydrolase 108 family protein [Lampropedia aestuarii]